MGLKYIVGFFHFKIPYMFICKGIYLCFVAYFGHMGEYLVMSPCCQSSNYSMFLWKESSPICSQGAITGTASFSFVDPLID